jgi:flagellar basal-body rod protein FlgC
MDLISGISASSSALSAQRTRLDVIAQNIANSNTTRGPDGQPYQRRTVSFEAAMLDASQGPSGMYAVRVAEIETDRTPGQRVNDPGHPDADADGMVTLSNVNLSMEMVDLISASRAYEANLSVVRSSRQMALKTLEIGK